jgi:general stress protein 26
MDQKFVQKAKEIIEKIKYINVATSSNTGSSWNTPLTGAFDHNYHFYWRSAKDAVHSMNIRANKKVFITIYDTSQQDWNAREAVYIQALAEELTNETEINDALLLIDKRSGKTFGKADNFLNDYPRRVYKAIPQKVWINTDGEVDGHFIDTRVEITLS